VFKLFELIADNRNRRSLAAKLRRKRAAFFEGLIAPLERPIRILDIGGTESYWKTMDFVSREHVTVVLLNIQAVHVALPNCVGVTGDARNLCYEDKSFDVIFSNSVIEHVGNYSDQARMAEEICRVGKRYFVQTPNRYFPIEPHFLFPFFQFLPIEMRIWLLMNFNLGWFAKMTDEIKARQTVESIRLLGMGEFTRLFPGAKLYKERILGLTKSLIVYGGWDV
jgi:hypothetical protein